MGDTTEEQKKNQVFNDTCKSIAKLVNTPEYQKAPWQYFQQIIDILDKHGIVTDALTPLERDQLIRSFKVENVVDHIGTGSAITTYVLSMLMIRQGQRLGGFTYNTITGIGTLFSFGCALSFTSSSFDLLQEYRRMHFRLKLVEYHQAYMILMLRLWLESLPDSEYTTHATLILGLLQKMIEQQIDDLKKEYESLQLLQNSKLLGDDYEEYERVSSEINDIDAQITCAQNNAKKIAKIDPKRKSADHLDEDVKAYRNQINDILHRPLYNVSLNKEQQYDASVSSRYATLSSTSLYAKRYGHLKNLAAYYLFTLNSKVVPDSDATLARQFLTKENRARFSIPDSIDENSTIFAGCLEVYRRKRDKLDVYNQYPKRSKKPAHYLNSLQIQYLQIQDELETIDEQIHHHEDALIALDSPIKARIEPVILDQGSKAESPGQSLLQNKHLKSYALKPFDTRTDHMWKAEWIEIKEFVMLIKTGIRLGVNQLMTPDHEKYQYRVKKLGYSPYHPRLWSYHIKQAISTLNPRLNQLATFMFVLGSLPYFIYYATKHFAHLLDGLQTVVDGIHKSVRDLDRSLSYHSGDYLWFILSYPLKVAWALICFIPETLGGITYWTLTALRSTLMKSEYNVAHTSRAINPRWLADWVEKQYTSVRAYKLTDRYIYTLSVIALYMVTLIGGVYNTVASLVTKVIPFYPTHDEHIRSSRDQLTIAWGLFVNGLISRYRYIIEDPIISSFKQSIDEHYRAEVKYPFKNRPFASSAFHVYIGLKFIAALIANVLLLGTYRSIKGLAKTAPVITATVVICSTLMPGISLPFFSFSFVAATQMKLAVLSMCGDCTNGTHDVYNLANNLKRRYRLNIIEHSALSKMKDRTNLGEFKYWLAVFEHIEVGGLLFDTMQLSSQQQGPMSPYLAYHLQCILSKRDKWVLAKDPDYAGMTLELLAHQLALYCVNNEDTANEKTQQSYMDYYHGLLSDNHLAFIARQISDTLPADHGLTSQQSVDYLAGKSVLAGYDFSRALMNQLRDKYRTQNRVHAHAVDLGQGLSDIAIQIKNAPLKTCLFSRGTQIKSQDSIQSNVNTQKPQAFMQTAKI